jgi:hypothetical protein
MRTISVEVDEQVSDADVALIKAEFALSGYIAAVSQPPRRRSLADFAWLVLASLPLQHFFARLAEDAADDAHIRLKTLADQLLRRHADAKPKPVMVLRDDLTGIQVVLEPDLPQESYRQLLSLDLASVRGPLHYDLQRRRWRSELDE